MKINHLSISWSVSRGRDTYGYNICRLDSRQSGSRYKCMGGGYDMIGTVFGDWLECEYQRELVELVAGLELQPYGNGGTGTKTVKAEDYKNTFYGLFVRADGSVYLDGACGLDCMKRVAEAIGLEVQWEGNRKGHTIGYFVSPKMLEAA
jgi:hypothetical protein